MQSGSLKCSNHSVRVASSNCLKNRHIGIYTVLSAGFILSVTSNQNIVKKMGNKKGIGELIGD